MTTLFLTYPGDATTRFDRDYYVNSHLPLVRATWGPHGLQTAAAFFPPTDGAGTISVCICEFASDAALQAALAAPQTANIIADVPHFTDAAPALSRAVAL
ncbi:ethyl tert-butyl ether degradation protein EthD [Hymenobacter psoromatis]|nr:ethyl tert-butyl ether degradation protein EthD [Hymenobacter psoromatis]